MNGLLAQLIPAEPQVSPLPSPPLWERALLEQPIYLAGFLFLAAIVTFTIFNQRGKAQQGFIAAAGIALAVIAALALGAAVKTEREQMAEATTALVDAATTGRPELVEPMLAPDVRLFNELRIPGVGTPTGNLDKPAILEAMRAAIKVHPLKEHKIAAMQAESTGPGVGRTQIRLRVVAEQYEIPHGSWWRISWRRSPDGRWQATSIEPLYIAFASSR